MIGGIIEYISGQLWLKFGQWFQRRWYKKKKKLR